MLTIDKVRRAQETLSGVARKTDIILASNLTDTCDLWLKTENLQRTGSFKLRGAYYKMSLFSDEEKRRGVVACSAGNHAQGVALAAQQFGIKATIFLPSAAPLSKIEATGRYGAEIVLVDGVYDDAYARAVQYAEETGAAFLHPFDDEDVIAGQATVGLEILNQLPNAQAIVVPVGGGGLISGVAYAVKTLKPSCKIYGVQALGADSMQKSYCNKMRTCAQNVATFADGIAVKAPGERTYAYCAKYVDDIVTVSDDETATAILSLLERQKLVAEGAGAVSVAAVMFDKLPVRGKKVCAGRLTNLTIELIDKPGQLKAVSALIADEGANVIRVRYTPGGETMDINGCYLNISMETRNLAHLNRIKEKLVSEGFKLCD
jgi:threonine dehydratase